MPINRHVVEQDVPEPALPLEEPDAVGPLVKPGLARGENGVSRVLVRQHLKGDGLHALPRFRENHSRLAVIQGRQDARAVTGQQKDTRKHQRGNVLKALPINDLPLKPRTLCRVQAGPVPANPAIRNAVETDLPRSRSNVTKLCTSGGMKSTSEGDKPSLTSGTGFFCSGVSGSPPFGGCITSAMRTLSTQEPSAFPADFWAIHKADLP